MQFLRDQLDKQKPLFEKGGKLEKLYPLYELHETLLFTPGDVTKAASHVRDAVDLKRIMITVVFALIPCIIVAIYNTGFQANAALAGLGPDVPVEGWRAMLLSVLGVGFNPTSILACMAHGLLYYLPIVAVTFIVGGIFEVIFAVVRKHDVNEGFLVTGMLFPLILPPTIPLWQVALGIAFGVVVGKEVFGGTGMNILNPALTARAFLFFAYPAQISGDKVWVGGGTQIDGVSGATLLGDVASIPRSVIAENADAWRGAFHAMDISWLDAFLGKMPGSMGETSALACLIGAIILIVTGVGSWRIMLGGLVGSFIACAALNGFGSETNALMNVPFVWHAVLGGWAFGLVFMATDPVSACYTDKGRLLYGFLIGVFAILIRVTNPAYPEGMMLAILFMNVFSPLIDYVVVQQNVKRRLARVATV